MDKFTDIGRVPPSTFRNKAMTRRLPVKHLQAVADLCRKLDSWDPKEMLRSSSTYGLYGIMATKPCVASASTQARHAAQGASFDWPQYSQSFHATYQPPYTCRSTRQREVRTMVVRLNRVAGLTISEPKFALRVDSPVAYLDNATREKV